MSMPPESIVQAAAALRPKADILFQPRRVSLRASRILTPGGDDWFHDFARRNAMLRRTRLVLIYR
jgi:hypothetical protein